MKAILLKSNVTGPARWIKLNPKS